MKQVSILRTGLFVCLFCLAGFRGFAQYDVAVYGIPSPVSSPALGSAAVVTVQVHNSGSFSVSNIPVQYSVNGVLSPVEYIPGPALPNVSVAWTFANTVDLSLCNFYSLKVWTLLPGDNNHANDTMSKTVAHFCWHSDTIYPNNAVGWTGTVTGPGAPTPYVLTDGIIHLESNNVQSGWAKFPLSSILPSTPIANVELNWFFYGNGPSYKINKLSSDPVISGGATIWNQLTSGYTYNPATQSSHSVSGWQKDSLGGGQIITDITNASVAGPNPWWACGFYEYENITPPGYNLGTIYGTIMPAYRPFLIVSYPLQLVHDVGIVSINVPSYTLAGSLVTPSAIVRNYGAVSETFDVTMTNPAGYSSTVTVFLAPGMLQLVTFSTMTGSGLGTLCFTACANLPNDQNLMNQCKTTCVTYAQTLTEAYGFVRYDSSGTFQPGPVKFYLEYPQSLTQLAVNTTADYLVSGTWGKSQGGTDAWYAAEVFNPPTYNHGYLYRINPVNGVYTSVGALGVNIDGMSYDYAQSKLWGIGSTYVSPGKYHLVLYDININTGQAVFYQDMGFTAGKVQSLACHASGMLFFTDTGNDQYYAYDIFTFEKEKVGPLGFNSGLEQDIEYNRADGRLYMTGHDVASNQGGLYEINPANGSSGLIGNFPNGLDVSGFAIHYTPPVTVHDIGIMWIKAPKTGPLTNTEIIMVKIQNYGSTAIGNFNISYQVDNGPIVTESWNMNGYPPLSPGDVVDYSFSTAYLDLSAPGASWCIRAWVWNLLGDFNQDNDSTAKCVTNTSCTITNLCYPNSQQEAEMCGNDLNGGCSSFNPAYVSLISGDAWCGTVWKIDTLMDQDWYTFSLPTLSTVVINARADFGLDVSLLSMPCSSSAVLKSIAIPQCNEDSLVYHNLPAGDYAVRIRPDFFFQDIICGFSDGYSMKFKSGYCSPSSGNYTGTAAYIKRVRYNGVDNNSGFTAGGYKDYTNLSGTVIRGVPFFIQALINGNNASDSVRVFIDWNNDLDFLDPDESFKINGTPYNVDRMFSGGMVIPANISPGPRVMRVRVMHDTLVSPCGDYFTSETEDYTLEVAPPPAQITTTIGSMTGPCLGYHEIPVSVDSSYDIQQIHFQMTVSPGITLLGIKDVNPLFPPSSYNIVQNGTQIIFDWFGLQPVSPGNALLFKLRLNMPQGTSYISWTPGNDSSFYYNDLLGLVGKNWIGSTLVFGICSDLDGNVYYAHQNAAGNPVPKLMGNIPGFTTVKVNLLQGTTVVDTAHAGYNGNYLFTNIPTGSYTVKANVTSPWGGVNAIDAQSIQMNMVNYNGFSLGPIYLKCGDINSSGGTPNSVDALLVMKRFVGMISNYMPPFLVPGTPDYYAESYPIVVNGSANQTQDVRVVCTGDVNGSYNSPPPPKSRVMINHEGSITAGSEMLEVPVIAEQSMNVGSVSLVLSYPAELEIAEVIISGTPENLVYLAKDGQLRLAWFSLDPLVLADGDVLLKMKVRAAQLAQTAQFGNTPETILSDGLGNIIEGASFRIPDILPGNANEGISLENVPNPFSSMTEIRYNLPLSGKISLKLYNILGEEISVMFEGDAQAGYHTLNFDGTSFGKGIYFYQLETEYGGIVRRMVVSD